LSGIDAGEVKYEIRDRIGIITLSRPGKRNSLTQAMFDQLSGIVTSLENNGEVRVAVIRGEEGAGFCAGDDLSELIRIESGGIRDFLSRAQSIFTRMEALPVPVIAAVKGYALGGGLELAMSCDMIFASEEAMLGLPETNLGIIPGLGGMIRLPRRIGLGRAREMVFSGRVLTASEARGIGLLEAVYPEDQLIDKTMEWARLITSKSPVSIALAKSVLNRGMDASLEAGLAMEREAFAYCFSLPDAKEGITAFLEKRPPKFGSK
jgi:enoyl-CoA hydratase